MTTFTQGVQPLEFLISEAPGTRSRTQRTVTIAGGVGLPSGTVLGKVTASGKFIKYTSGAADGSQTAVAVLGTDLVGKANGDYKALVFDADCEVIGNRLNGMAGTDAGGLSGLLAVGIKVR